MYTSITPDFESIEPENLEISSSDDFNGHEPYLNELNYLDPLSEMDFVFPQEENSSSAKLSTMTKDNLIPKWENVFLTSMTIMNQINKENEKRPRSLKVECQLWTRGFDRSFKVLIMIVVYYYVLRNSISIQRAFFITT